MAAVVVRMLFIEIFRTAWTVGAPSLAAILVAYAVVRRARRRVFGGSDGGDEGAVDYRGLPRRRKQDRSSLNSYGCSIAGT